MGDDAFGINRATIVRMVEEIAEVMEISPRTIERDWDFSKAWLKRELSQ